MQFAKLNIVARWQKQRMYLIETCILSKQNFYSNACYVVCISLSYKQDLYRVRHMYLNGALDGCGTEMG